MRERGERTERVLVLLWALSVLPGSAALALQLQVAGFCSDVAPYSCHFPGFVGVWVLSCQHRVIAGTRYVFSDAWGTEGTSPLSPRSKILGRAWWQFKR